MRRSGSLPGWLDHEARDFGLVAKRDVSKRSVLERLSVYGLS